MKSVLIPSIPVSREIRGKLGLPDDRFDKRGRLKIGSPREARDLAIRIGNIQGGMPPSPADLYGAAWILSAWRLMLDVFGDGDDPFEDGAVKALSEALGSEVMDRFMTDSAGSFTDDAVWHGRRTPGESARREAQKRNGKRRLSGRERTIRSYSLAWLAEENPAFEAFAVLFQQPGFSGMEEDRTIRTLLNDSDKSRPEREPEDAPPLATLRKPVEAAPHSVKDQLLYILTRWGTVLGNWSSGLIGALDMIEEETRPRFDGGPGPVRPPGLDDLGGVARFSDDHDWMPRVVMVAKNILVWLDQLSKTWAREIRTLDAVPDEELDTLASRGFNALWLIGLWERSAASREIKQRMGNPEAAASAYSLFGYDIDPKLGGWEALENLRSRAGERGIRLSSDMVPNHVGIDSDWVRQHPDRLLSVSECPYPSYGWGSENLSDDPGVDIHLEDHYWDHSDAAVVFKRTDNGSGETRYVYHGNDGTTMPWNDTAQIDFLNAEAREAVIQDILHVARNFPVIRFDAAMVLARKSIRRLWYPPPGAGGAIPSRSEYALTDEEFQEACPAEFWRDVVDRVASEIPGTLLLAEAFWMMEGFFVRNLGMHRVYNSAFMNMLRDGKNSEYRGMMKKTLAFEPGILQRYVNFMNNPDEETAVDQFGKDDRYFATATLLATLPGLPMFGHGQVEGLSEKYGMEYVKAYKDEAPDPDLITRHEREIFPLVHRRSLFAGALAFRLYDFQSDDGVNENVFAYSNTDHLGPALILVNNAYEKTSGNIHSAAPVKLDDSVKVESLAEALVPGHLGDADWVLIREMISGLWFLRSAGELRDNGLAVSIDGFGRQLFLDYRYEKESPDGIWGRLASELAGTGVADPDDAAAQIRLRPLRSALNSILDPGYVTKAASSLQRGRKPVWPNKKPEIAALLDAHREITGQDTRASPDSLDGKIRKRLSAAASHGRLFGGGLQRLADRLYPGTGDDEGYLVVYCVVDTLISLNKPDRASEVRAMWGLDRWLTDSGFQDIATDLGARLSAAGMTGNILSAVSSGKPDAGRVLSRLFADGEFRTVCGVNTWDGVIWFGGEEWDRSQRALLLGAGCDINGGISGLVSRIRIRRIMKAWKRSADVSGYRLDSLLKGIR